MEKIYIYLLKTGYYNRHHIQIRNRLHNWNINTFSYRTPPVATPDPYQKIKIMRHSRTNVSRK